MTTGEFGYGFDTEFACVADATELICVHTTLVELVCAGLIETWWTVLLILDTEANMATALAFVAGWDCGILCVINDIVSDDHDSLGGLLDVYVDLRDLNLDARAGAADECGSISLNSSSHWDVDTVRKII